MIKVEHISKKFGSVRALDDVSFEVAKGQIMGFLGPNGAGKTTTMNILSGYLAADSGRVSVAGFNVEEDPVEAKSRIGYLPEQPPIYDNMRVIEFLHFAGELKGMVRNNIRDCVESAMASVGIAEQARQVIKTLSKGYKQRLGLAYAVLNRPEVLILDEPTIGLDPNQIVEIRRLIKNLAGEHTVILSTHILSEVQLICGTAAIINKGRIMAIGSIEELLQRSAGLQILKLEIIGEKDTIRKEMKGIEGIENVEIEKGSDDSHSVILRGNDMESKRKVIFGLSKDKNWTILEMKLEKSNLEDVFMKLTAEEQDNA